MLAKERHGEHKKVDNKNVYLQSTYHIYQPLRSDRIWHKVNF